MHLQMVIRFSVTLQELVRLFVPFLCFWRFFFLFLVFHPFELGVLRVIQAPCTRCFLLVIQHPGMPDVLGLLVSLAS